MNHPIRSLALNVWGDPMDLETFRIWYGGLASLALAMYVGRLALWHAGTRRYGWHRKWARRLGEITTLYVFFVFLWSMGYLLGVDGRP